MKDQVRDRWEQVGYPAWGQVDHWVEPCMHDSCSQCHGTGRKADGSSCIHMISCNCPKCTVQC